MDTDDYTCGACKHGNLYSFCEKCEDDNIKADLALMSLKAEHHKRNDARALALQIRQPGNGEFL